MHADLDHAGWHGHGLPRSGIGWGWTAGLVLLPLLVTAAAAPASGAPTLWIGLGDPRSIHGPLVLGQKTGVVEEGALGDFLVSAVCVTPAAHDGGDARYEVQIREPASYYLWARMRCPAGLPESFLLVDEDPSSPAPRRYVLGGPAANLDRWHWVRAARETAPAEGEPGAAITLGRGSWRFRIEPREASQSVYRPGAWRMGRPDVNPRLNLLCLTADGHYVPGDADAQRALAARPTQVDVEQLRARPTVLPPMDAAAWQRSGKQPLPDWLRCPRFFTKDSWRAELDQRKPGDIAAMVRQIAANEGTAFRLGGYWGGDAYYQSQVTRHTPGLGTIDYLREATAEGDRLGVKIVLYINPNALFRDHPLWPRSWSAARTARRSRPWPTASATRNTCASTIPATASS
jgi:hypothetical protein